MNAISDDDLPVEIDFSHAVQGQFFRPGMRINLPIYLDDEVAVPLATLANGRGVELSRLVNELLKQDLELIRVATAPSA